MKRSAVLGLVAALLWTAPARAPERAGPLADARRRGARAPARPARDRRLHGARQRVERGSARGSSSPPGCARATSGSAARPGLRAPLGRPREHRRLRRRASGPAHRGRPAAPHAARHRAVYVLANQAIAQGLDGTGVLVGIADTGLDVTHPDFLDAQGHTRVAWLLDLSSPPRGVHPDLEQQFGVAATSTGQPARRRGVVGRGHRRRASPRATPQLPHDEVGHGTLVTSCAAGNGRADVASTGASRPARPSSGAHHRRGDRRHRHDDVLLGAGFLFDRADRDRPAHRRQPLARQRLRSSRRDDGVGAGARELRRPDHPGHALVAAAGNSGSIAPTTARRPPERLRERRARPCASRSSAVASQDGGVAGLGRDARGRDAERRPRRPRRHVDRAGRRRRSAGKNTERLPGGHLQRQQR